MRKMLIGVLAVGLIGGATWYYRAGQAAAPPVGADGAPAAGAAGTGRGRGRGASTMAVETATATRHDVVSYITVVGNLIGETTVDVVPRVAGRIDSILVKLGDRVTKGQPVVKLEDRALREQINQVRANIEVNQATVISRENDLKVTKNNLDRAQTSFERGLVSQQALEDADSRYNSAASQVTVAKAQLVSTQARLEELTVTLTDTTVLSPVDGFVSRRNLDPGAFAGANTPILSVVDIGVVRMVANLVEKDFRRIVKGAQALVEVDAFPGEEFMGTVSRVAPVFDPATRTATMEIEVPNPGFRLKPGMYARVRLTAGRNPDALTVPRAAVVDVEGKRGVYTLEGDVARFTPVETGLVDTGRVEILSGIAEGTRVVTTGSTAIRHGDRVALTGPGGRGGERGAGRATAASGSRPGAARPGGDAAAAGEGAGGRRGGRRGGGSAPTAGGSN